MLAPGGLLTIEFPHLLRLVGETQFDTIYHEHFSYLSLRPLERVFAAHDLAVVDVAELPTHGGSLRVYARHAGERGEHPRVAALRREEDDAGLYHLDTHRAFAERVKEIKRGLLVFLVDAARSGARLVGYGAAAKGATLLNYCGIRDDLLAYVVDRSPHKQGRYVPGVRLPILAPEALDESPPDIVLLLAWNLKDEVVAQLAHLRSAGTRFVVPLPAVAVVA